MLDENVNLSKLEGVITSFHTVSLIVSHNGPTPTFNLKKEKKKKGSNREIQDLQWHFR